MRRVLRGHALYASSSGDAVEGVVRQMVPPLSRGASPAGDLVASPSVTLAAVAVAATAAQPSDAAAESARHGDACSCAADPQAAEGREAGHELPPAPPLSGGGSCASGAVAGETDAAEGGCLALGW
jgi:hypothetical protein